MTRMKQRQVANLNKIYTKVQLDIFLDPNDPEVLAAARAEGIPENWLTAAQESPVYKMAIDWKLAFPLHPEYRTYGLDVPPLSPIQAAANSEQLGMNGNIPDVRKAGVFRGPDPRRYT